MRSRCPGQILNHVRIWQNGKWKCALQKLHLPHGKLACDLCSNHSKTHKSKLAMPTLLLHFFLDSSLPLMQLPLLQTTPPPAQLLQTKIHRIGRPIQRLCPILGREEQEQEQEQEQELLEQELQVGQPI